MYLVKILFLLLLISTICCEVWAYPIDGYPYTGIRRLERRRLIHEKELPGRPLPAGALKKTMEIRLNLIDNKPGGLNELQINERLQMSMQKIFYRKDTAYSCVILDITNEHALRLALWNPDAVNAPGSIAKLAIAAGLFTELCRLFPDDFEKRIHLLQYRKITADRWAMPNHHRIPIFNPADRTLIYRNVRPGDTFSLYEWLDHMISPSSNAAASIVWKEVILMRAFKDKYPPDKNAEERYFNETPGEKLQEIALSVVNTPLRKMGIGENELELGSFFTSTGKKIIPGAPTRATALGLMKFIYCMEKGNMVDHWSSLELKKLMYLTKSRGRYAAASSLEDAAVYFKSGSLYSCRAEPGYKCEQYRGNVYNYMNSVTIVEHPDGTKYMVSLMSNVLKKNSSYDHMAIAEKIDRIIRK